MHHKLSLKDRRLLYELDVNSRQPLARLAKKLHMSKQVAAYRMNRLVRDGTIQKFLTIMDTSKLGFSTYKIFLRMQNLTKEKEMEVIEYLKNHPRVQWFASTDGSYDMVFNILAKNADELYEKLKEIDARYGDYIAEKPPAIMVLAEFYFRDYLVGKTAEVPKKRMYFGSNPRPVQIDNVNSKILSLLGNDARISNTDIASAAEISPDTVRERIKKLENAGIIQSYVLVLDNAKLGQMHYKVLFSLRNLSEKLERQLDGFFAMHPNIYFHNKGIGLFDAEINLEVENERQFRETMMLIKEKFSGIMKNYIVLNMYKIHKFNFYPM